MNISICITVLNEEASVGKLIRSLLNQTRKADEIVIVDGGSKDKTVEIIKHFQKKNKSIKLLQEKCSRARGRNLAVEVADSEIIAMTDAGCVARPDWLEKISGPFANPEVDVVAGFYKMLADNPFQKSARFFGGVLPSQFDAGFLPSTRSVAFRKNVWEDVGGFPEEQAGAAEDTVFNFKLLKQHKKISRVKDAVVEWGMPTSINDFQLAIYNYAKGDAQSKIWLFPGKGLASHNIKAIFVFLRYGLGLFLLFYALLSSPPVSLYLSILIFLYALYAYRKAGLWGVILQVTSDIAVMLGFISGLLLK